MAEDSVAKFACWEMVTWRWQSSCSRVGTAKVDEEAEGVKNGGGTKIDRIPISEECRALTCVRWNYLALD